MPKGDVVTIFERHSKNSVRKPVRLRFAQRIDKWSAHYVCRFVPTENHNRLVTFRPSGKTNRLKLIKSAQVLKFFAMKVPLRNESRRGEIGRWLGKLNREIAQRRFSF